MPLSAGTQLGHYEILAPIGAGGMGEVYKARDTSLNRDVAIKVLPDVLANDTTRMERFHREAQVLAQVNHPNICTIHGVEKSEGVYALVMELVEGPTLADRLETGPMPLEEALPVARQIAEALEAAHESGIVHRDLKPANVKVRPDGTVKVLDFGLAKALEGDPASMDPATSPTLTIAATQVGVILGTASYMSPEQASGKPVDRRADCWSFGVVLWEMLSARKLFEGETVSHTLADVLRAEVDFSVIPDDTPPGIRRLLRRCLERNPKRRLQAIGEARIAIDEYLGDPAGASVLMEAPAAVPQPVDGKALPWMVAVGLLAAALAVSLVGWWRDVQPVEQPLAQFDVDLGSDIWVAATGGPSVTLSPDGRRLVFGSGGMGRTTLFTRELSQPQPTVLSGTE
ncbi:MAG: serine/threonine protein kinase, partial [bacterium]|nr:serine/threonine protein kinase [bacterium]